MTYNLMSAIEIDIFPKKKKYYKRFGAYLIDRKSINMRLNFNSYKKSNGERPSKEKKKTLAKGLY